MGPPPPGVEPNRTPRAPRELQEGEERQTDADGHAEVGEEGQVRVRESFL